jgi:hypothetical protein
MHAGSWRMMMRLLDEKFATPDAPPGEAEIRQIDGEWKFVPPETLRFDQLPQVFVRTEAAAAIAGCDRKTLKRLGDEGFIRFKARAGGLRKYSLPDVVLVSLWWRPRRRRKVI